MSTAIENLGATLAEAVALLEAHGDTGVAPRLRADRDQLLSGDQTVIDTIIAETTGTMGSFRDLIISRANGHKIAQSDQARANRLLAELVDRAKRQALIAKDLAAPH